VERTTNNKDSNNDKTSAELKKRKGERADYKLEERSQNIQFT